MPTLIEFEHVSIMRNGRTILDDVNLTIQAGEHVAILGPNGCGKSTFIRALAREIYPFAGIGVVRIEGRERWTIAELRSVLGMVSEEPRSPLLGNPTGLELAVSGLLGTYGVVAQHNVRESDLEKALDTLGKVGAAHLADRQVETMSTGERRRCFIARSLIPQPKALVLDEPTTGLDLKGSSEFHNLLRDIAKSGVSIILVTHHLEEIIPEILRIVFLKEGRVIQDGPREQVLTTSHLTNLFDVDPERIRFGAQNLTAGRL